MEDKERIIDINTMMAIAKLMGLGDFDKHCLRICAFGALIGAPHLKFKIVGNKILGISKQNPHWHEILELPKNG